MHTATTLFRDAIYHKEKVYTFGPTDFNGRELKTLFLINGKRTIQEISHVLGLSEDDIRPVISRLTQLSIIQTEDDVMSEDLYDVVFGDEEMPMYEYTVYRLSKAA